MIDVREAFETDKEVLVDAPKNRIVDGALTEPHFDSALKRIKVLKDALTDLKARINDTDCTNTGEAWAYAYDTLTMAINNCIVEETEIILRS